MHLSYGSINWLQEAEGAGVCVHMPNSKDSTTLRTVMR